VTFAPALLREVARGAAQSASYIQQMKSRPERQLLGQVNRRLSAADVKLIDRRQIGIGKA
jgi:hypothetical protein